MWTVRPLEELPVFSTTEQQLQPQVPIYSLTSFVFLQWLLMVDLPSQIRVELTDGGRHGISWVVV